MKNSESGKPSSGKQGSGKVANGLVAMSCAGVLAVYAAGYVRTRSAADQLDAQSVERRVAQDAPRVEPASAEVRPAEIEHGEQRIVESASSAPESRAAAAVGPLPVVNSPDVTSAAVVETAVPPAPVNVVAAPVVAAPVIAAAPLVAAPEPKLAVVSLVAPPTPAPAPQAAAPASVPAPKWKDGTYYGWGTSRHGDIQAEVVIAGGRIASATISDCRTRYPCSVIDRLPPEVAQRQSPEVDYISRATQSTNAFYYAVVEALGKAK